MNTPSNQQRPEPAYLLRVMSGPQSGAEIPLADGEYVIGSDDACDLVLLDRTVAARHLRVSIAVGSARAEACDAPVAVGNHSLASGEAADVGAGAVFGLASTCVAIAPVGVDWSALQMPDRRRGARAAERPGATVPAPTVNGVPAVESVAEAAASAAVEAGGRLTGTEATSEGNALDGLADKVTGKAAGAGRRGVPATVWAIGGFVVALALFELPAMVSSWTANLVSQPQPTNEDNQRSRVQALLKQLGLGGVQLANASGRGLALTGYVSTVADKNRLSDALEQGGIRLRNEVWADDWIKSSAQETVQRFGGEALSFDYLGKGAVRIGGFLRSGVTRQQLKAVLRNDVPGISTIEIKLRTMDQALSDLHQGLQSAGLEGLVRLSTNDVSITATGTLDEPLLQAWWKVAHGFAKDYGAIPQLRSEVKSATRRAEPLMLGQVRVIGVVMGPEHKPMAMLEDGSLVGVGDRIGANAVVEEIEFDKVLVREGTRTYTFNVEGG